MAEQGVQELAPGLWRTVTAHPGWRPQHGTPGGWGPEVASHFVETPGSDTILLVDPNLPPEASPDHARFFRALDRDLERSGAALAVVVLNAMHGRSTQALLDRYGARAQSWVPAAAASGLNLRADHTCIDGAVLPGGAEVIGLPGLDVGESALHLPAFRSLIVADALVGEGGGRLRVAPASWGRNADEHQRLFLPALARLRSLGLERILTSHGEPALRDAAGALDRALLEPPWGE